MSAFAEPLSAARRAVRRPAYADAVLLAASAARCLALAAGLVR